MAKHLLNLSSLTNRAISMGSAPTDSPHCGALGEVPRIVFRTCRILAPRGQKMSPNSLAPIEAKLLASVNGTILTPQVNSHPNRTDTPQVMDF